jgi:hypothetical protein
MDGSVHATLAAWANFYLVTGTAAAALTGLQFVVQTLIASGAPGEAVSGDPEGGIAAFGTPTVVHFAAALVLSAVMCAPWPGFGGLRTTLGALGAGALVYSARVLERARRQQGYAPVLQDWIWHIVLPALAYAAVLTASMLLGQGATGPLFALAGATLLLVCVGIHNAWDTVTYLSLSALGGAARRDDRPPPA